MKQFTFIGPMKIETSKIKEQWAVDAYNKLDKQTPEEALNDIQGHADDIHCLIESEGYTTEEAYDSVLNNLGDTALGL